MTFESLPVELIADILGELDLKSLITLSYLSRRLHDIASDSSLNPWRRPILRTLRSGHYEDCLRHLSVRRIVPRQNWVEVLTLAYPSFILFEATLPNLKMFEWEECFNRRFLPGLRKWKKDGTWKAAYLKSVLPYVGVCLAPSKCYTDLLGCYIESITVVSLPVLQMKHGPSWYPGVSLICSQLTSQDILSLIAMVLLMNSK